MLKVIEVNMKRDFVIFHGIGYNVIAINKKLPIKTKDKIKRKYEDKLRCIIK